MTLGTLSDLSGLSDTENSVGFGQTRKTLPEIRREALGRRIDAEQTRSLLDGLVRAGWLKLVTTKTGGRAILRWQVNPLVFSGAPSPERSERSERRGVS
jgi:hypothetical protein